MSLQALFPTLASSVSTANGPLSTSSDFEILGLALDATGLANTVSGLGDFTLFAPTDGAFASLATSLGYAGDPDIANDIFGFLAGALGDLDPNGDPIPLLTDILLYHVSPEDTGQDVLNGGGDVPTLLDGAQFQVTGGTIVDNDAGATNADIVAADIGVPSGTIQVIDQVLLPIDTPVDDADPNLLDTVKESGGAFDDDATDFDLLLTALQATGLDAAVDDNEADLTVFLPNDGAFVSLAQQLGYEGDDEGEAFQAILDASADADPENPLALVTDILTYHVLPQELDSTDILAADDLTTLNGATIEVDGTTLVDADPNNDDVNLIQTDIQAANGIAQVIDDVLLPTAIVPADGDLPVPAVPEDDLPPDEAPEGEVDNDDDDNDFSDILGFGFFAFVLATLVGGGGLAFF